MSAYIVNKDHVLYLLQAASSHQLSRMSSFSWYHDGQHHTLPPGDWDRAAEVGNMLWAENMRSVSHRYPGESSATLPGPNGDSFVIEPRDMAAVWLDLNPVEVLKSCSCYSYQTCEHPEWEQSESFAFIRALERQAIRALPGYDAAKWGAPDRTTRRATRLV